jgi:2'-5' RNA ligase
MRLFIAVPIPEQIQVRLSEMVSDLKKSYSTIRWIPHGNLHLTLKFLGEVSEQAVPKIQECMLKVVKETHLLPFEIYLAGVGAFPNPIRPRVIWVGIMRGEEELAKLANGLENELESLGFLREERSFKPHLTIGRVREPKMIKGFKEKTSAFEKTSFASFSGSMISLMQSVLNPKGAVYTTVYEVKLV